MKHKIEILFNAYSQFFFSLLVLVGVSGCGRLKEIEEYRPAQLLDVFVNNIKIYIENDPYFYNDQNIRALRIINENDPKKSEIRYYVKIDKYNRYFIEFEIPMPSYSEVKKVDMSKQQKFLSHFSVLYNNYRLPFECTLIHKPPKRPDDIPDDVGFFADGILYISELRCRDIIYLGSTSDKDEDIIVFRIGVRQDELYPKEPLFHE